jgi:putative hydrolase of the HAD superfamily
MWMRLQTMFFDVGGTLETYSCTRELRIANTSGFRNLLEDHGVKLQLTDDQLYELITLGIKAYRKWSIDSMIELNTLEIWSGYVFKNGEVSANILQKVTEQLSYYYEMNYYTREMRPEVPKVLAEIKKLGLRIGCISNTQSVTQVPLTLERYGIREYFDPVVLSSVYGRRKPDPSIFYQAARLANSPTGACAYIGDKISRDVLGSKRAGFKLAMQVRHDFDDGEIDEGAIPDAIVSNLEELVPLLEEVLNENGGACTDPNCTVKAIFFDAGDILYYRPQRDQHLNEFLAGRKTNPAPDFEVERKRIKDLAFSGQMKRHDYYRELIKLYGIVDPQEIEEGIRAISRDDNTVAIVEGVPETINALKQKGYLLGIITDTAMPFSRKLNWFDEHGFGRVWDVVISSKEMGVRKPAPSMYEEALSQTGVKPSEAVFVGHKTHELDGARAVGMKTVAFNYDADARADVYIEKFCNLLDISLFEH